jgi:hypothetical protein
MNKMNVKIISDICINSKNHIWNLVAVNKTENKNKFFTSLNILIDTFPIDGDPKK